MVLQHSWKMQLRPTKTEIHSRFVLPFYKLRQFVPGPQPGQDAVALPAPGKHLFAREVAGEEPGVFLGIFLDAAMEPVVVPTQRNEHPLMLFFHQCDSCNSTIMDIGPDRTGLAAAECWHLSVQTRHWCLPSDSCSPIPRDSAG